MNEESLYGGGQLDFLDLCAAAGTSNPALEEIQQRSSEVVLAVFRLAKIVVVHAIDNDAVRKIVNNTHEILTTFSGLVGESVTITFVQEESIFVCGELLRGTRAVYEAATELGSMLRTCDVSEVSFTSEVSKNDIFTFAKALSVSLGDPKQRSVLASTKVPNIKARKVDAILSHSGDEDESDLDMRSKTLKTYASALLVIREFYESLAAGRNVLPHRAKRIAQKLVMIAEESESTLMGMTTLSYAKREDATRALHAAILSILVGRQITDDRVLLSKLALAALLADAGRAQVAGPERLNKLVRLPEEIEAAVPSHSAAITFITGGIRSASAMRAVSAFETTWMEREHILGRTYRGRFEPTVLSKILRLVRALLDLVAPRDISEAMTPFDALAELSGRDWAEPQLLKLLTSTIGLIPSGTVVEFASGEWGVVIGPSDNPEATHLPKVKIITDKRGKAVDAQGFLDLGVDESAARNLRISGIVPPGKAKFNVTRAFLPD